MLVRHSIINIVALLGMTVFLNTVEVYGQGPMMGPGPYDQGGGGPFVAPESYQNPQVMYQPGYPGMQPYPGIDMYRWDKQQTVIKDGIWMHNLYPHDVTMTSSFEYLKVMFDNPNGVFGYGGGFDSLQNSIGFINIRQFAPRLNANSTFTPGSNAAVINFGAQPADLGHVLPDTTSNPGFRVSFGAEQSDGTKIEINGFWSERRAEHLFRGQDPSLFGGDPSLYGQTPIQGGVPLAGTINVIDLFSMANPTIILDLGNGVPTIVPFDEFVDLRWTTQAWGTGISLLRAPIYEGEYYRVRPTVGARFLRVFESYGFKGQDSGAAYTFQVQNGSAAVDPVGGTNYPGITAGQPTATPNFWNGEGNNPLNGPVPQYRMEINSQSTSNLTGPEIGLRLDVGKGEFMKAYILASAGLLINQDKQKLRGFGVGNYFIDNDGNGRVDGLETPLTSPDLDFADNGLRSRIFTDSRTQTTISPMYELGANVEVDLLKHIPYLNKMEITENTVIKVGYSYLHVSNFVRPNESIDFFAYPNVPKLNGSRGSWNMQTFSIGLESTF